MTAIQANAAPQHAQIAAAKSRFMLAVNKGITDLMQQCGYSRDRATAALLRELGRGDGTVENQEVFDTMTTFGLGVDDASHALTVSRAVQRAMKERGLSAVEAIDDLSTKLNISNLVSCGATTSQEGVMEPLVSSRPSSPQLQRATPPTSSSTCGGDRVSSTQQQQRASKGRKGSGAKTSHKNGKQKASKQGGSANTRNQSRKRCAPDDKFSTGRERADSVTEAVEAKAKKARLSPEDSPAAAPEDAIAAVVRTTKRNASMTLDVQQSNTV